MQLRIWHPSLLDRPSDVYVPFSDGLLQYQIPRGIIYIMGVHKFDWIANGRRYKWSQQQECMLVRVRQALTPLDPAMSFGFIHPHNTAECTSHTLCKCVIHYLSDWYVDHDVNKTASYENTPLVDASAAFDIVYPSPI
jgi:hypothetical protein